ncbi:MAG: glycosyltransferase [Bacteroidia bacterium]|nr:glycosyltransferase [Bacteroidia bacterium]
MKRSLPPILCIGFPAWEGDYQKSTVQLMQALSEEQQVLYVEFAFTWKDVIQGILKGKKPYKRILGISPRLRRLRSDGLGSLHVLTLPPIIPINGLEAGASYERMAKLNARVIVASIRKALRKLNYHKPVALNAFNPFLGVYLKGKLDLSAEYYYCYDQIGAAKWTNRHGPRLEDKYLSMVDGVITSSAPLLAEKQGNLPGIVIKNGVNLSIFEQAFRSEPRRTGAPVLGYLGSIDDRLDLDMLLAMLNNWPGARLLLVGRIMEEEIRERLVAHPQVEITGGLQPDELPAWVEKMDVGLIPFVKNEFTRFIYPLKINEYLAAGLPVVSTGFSDLSDFSEVIYEADESVSFQVACKLAFQEDSHTSRLARQAFAKSHDWKARAEECSNWIEEQLLQKSS